MKVSEFNSTSAKVYFLCPRKKCKKLHFILFRIAEVLPNRVKNLKSIHP